VTKAPAADQRRLLDVQALDTRSAQLAHRRKTLPALADLEAVRTRLVQAEREQVTAKTLVKDLSRELAKAETDVELVRSRADRDRKRLESGSGTAKDLQALTHELESLARRQGVLEEAELEVMERLEDAERAHEAVAAHVGELKTREAALMAELGTAEAAIDADASVVAKDRLDAVSGLDAALLALYERLRVHGGGLGAAALRGNRCEGCRLELNPTDLEAIRAMAPDDVARCEECGRILVRSEAGGGSA
jgi:predicted  nucleic acid-binding Zn-ribbon protein